MKIERRIEQTWDQLNWLASGAGKGTFGYHVASTILHTGKPHLARWPLGRWTIWELK